MTRPSAALGERRTAEAADSPDDSGGTVRTDKASAPLHPEGKTTESVEILTPVEPPQTFEATAYSLPGKTASGKLVTRGLIAADRRVLPLGTRVRLEAGPYSGEYLVADTGGTIRGREIDIWMPSSSEALKFGRRKVKLTILARATGQSSKRLRKG